MDIAKTSITMNQAKLQMNASFAVMNKTKQFAEQQGEQLIEMLETATPNAPHPTNGHKIDISV